jgi:predicted DNA-binding transcriptional regulator YafY
MPRIADDDKRARLDRVYILLKRHENGLTSQEIAGQLNLERRTVDNYLAELETEGRVYKESKYWLALPYDAIALRRLEPSPEEAVALYLAVRLLVKQADKSNEVAETMLYKLAQILGDDLRLGEDIIQATKSLAERPLETNYQGIFKTIVRGYIYRRLVQITYAPYQGRMFETTIAPYLLEPSGIGYSTYVIGHSSSVNDLRTYKMERIQRAQLLRDGFEIPQDFPGIDILRNAWAIYHGEAVVHVILRFSPQVARRVRETTWHPSQRLVRDPERDGFIQLHLDIADTTDLKPWIRGWGAACEVLEPVSLHQEVAGEVRQLARAYGWRGDDDTTTILNDIFRSQ